MNGKTIGRMRPAPADEKPVESIAAFAESDATERAAFAALGSRIRRNPASVAAEHVTLKRQIAVERARANLYSMGCDPRNPTRPVQTAFEREREFERLLIAMGDMTTEARAKAVGQLIEDTKAYVAKRDDWSRQIEEDLKTKPPEYDPTKEDYGHDPALRLAKK